MGKHKFAIDGKDFEVDVGTRKGTTVPVTVNGRTYDVELSEADAMAVSAVAGAIVSAPVAAPTGQRAAAQGGSPGEVRAPMAGLVLKVNVSVGARVEAGDVLLVLEAMKMENAIAAPAAGSVTRVNCSPQQTVNQGDVLIEIG